MGRRPGGMDEERLWSLMQDDEGENLEFKTSLIDRKEIGEYAVGIGNAGGGWLILGVTDRKPRQVVGVKDVAHKEQQRIVDSVLDATGIRIQLESVKTGQGEVLAVRIPPRPRGQIYSTRGGKFLTRAGEGLRGMTLAEIERIRDDELGHHDVLAEIIPVAWERVVDPVELNRLRQILVDKQRSELAELEGEELLRTLELLRPGDGGMLPTRAVVLLVGTEQAVRDHVGNHEIKLQRFDVDELNPVFSEDSRKPLLAVIQRTEEVVEVANEVKSFQEGMFRVDVPRFPRLAYREAVANALIHRDYERSGNVALRVYRDRLEVANPGGWFGSVNERNILVTESQRRNELLASMMQRIGLAERSALGVKRMFRSMLAAGKEPPSYRATSTTVTVVLSDGSFDRQFASFARRCHSEDVDLNVFKLLVLNHVRRHREIRIKEAARLCQQNEASARRLLDGLRNDRLLDRQGTGKGRRWVLGKRSYEWLDLLQDRPSDLGISERTFIMQLLDELERSGRGGLTRREITEWSEFDAAKVGRVLKKLVQQEKIGFSGKRGMGARYWYPKNRKKYLEKSDH